MDGMTLAEHLVAVNYQQCTRKGDLFACACSFAVWPWVKPHVQQEIEYILRRCEDTSLPEIKETVLDDGYGTPILHTHTHPHAAMIDEPLKMLWCGNAEDWDACEFQLPKEIECEWVGLLRCIYGPNPFDPQPFSPSWRTEHTIGIAARVYDDRDFAAMPILADALEEAGCDNAEILAHCREPGVHVRGCWVVDLVLDKT